MKKILFWGLIAGVIWAGLTMDEGVLYFIINNAMWMGVVAVLSLIIVYLIKRITTPIEYTTTTYNITHTRYDYSHNTATTNQYLDLRQSEQIADSRPMMR